MLWGPNSRAAEWSTSHLADRNLGCTAFRKDSRKRRPKASSSASPPLCNALSTTSLPCHRWPLAPNSAMHTGPSASPTPPGVSEARNSGGMRARTFSRDLAGRPACMPAASSSLERACCRGKGSPRKAATTPSTFRLRTRGIVSRCFSRAPAAFLTVTALGSGAGSGALPPSSPPPLFPSTSLSLPAPLPRAPPPPPGSPLKGPRPVAAAAAAVRAAGRGSPTIVAEAPSWGGSRGTP
mmetsp:Transcript_5572/g.15965  ORF Transcript_5572/g.15965 Transcript_5572/m.15965 type:complete len:238 (-) Transcript_5572:2559-3272(-)